MKVQLTNTLLAASFLMILATSCTQKMSLQSSSNIKTFEAPASPAPASSVVTNEVEMKVLRSFYKTYGEISGVRWYKSANGFIASFKFNNIDNIVYYRANGSVDASIHYYFEKQLAAPVKDQVKTLFPNYSATHITEVKKNGITAFYVQLQDAVSIKTVKVVGDEWEVVAHLVKR